LPRPPPLFFVARKGREGGTEGGKGEKTEGGREGGREGGVREKTGIIIVIVLGLDLAPVVVSIGTGPLATPTTSLLRRCVYRVCVCVGRRGEKPARKVSKEK